ncbi:MBOAT, membrane-bound O-acyltransferase family-domain-containing protein [Parasitella parasitica]|nr:MBOAT, membrane-bound O-acyltransferase family-domain-containing protein [Parasitella parasitica]
MYNIITELISWLVGVPEPNVRLFLTLIAAYPIGYQYHQLYVIQNPNANRQARNMYILGTGLALALFFSGFNLFHSLITIATSYCLCYLGNRFHNRRAGTTAVWLFNFVYLLLGYYFTASEEYDISWTTSQCVLCLRLIGFSMDYMDGGNLRKEQGEKLTGPHSFASDCPLQSLPEWCEFLAYCYFPSAFLIGPQFSFSLYSRFLSGPYNGEEIRDTKHVEKIQLAYIIRCLSIGITYIIVLQTVCAYYPTSYILTKEYAAKPLLQRNVDFWLCGKMVFVKYIGVWLLTEGASTCFGITFQKNGTTAAELSFSGLANSKPLEFELMTSVEQLIPTFNINTNLWVKQYVFKRLRFLENKDLSQIGALTFLAIWHGFHFGYFETFFLEFSFIFIERILRKRLYTPIVKPLIDHSKYLFYCWELIAWMTANTCLAYAMVGFDLLTFSRSVQAHNSVYWYAHVVSIVLLVLHLFLSKRGLRNRNKYSKSA